MIAAFVSITTSAPQSSQEKTIMVTSITSAAGVPTSSTESANVSKHRQPAVLCPSEREHAAQLAINPIHGKWKMESCVNFSTGRIVRASRARPCQKHRQNADAFGSSLRLLRRSSFWSGRVRITCVTRNSSGCAMTRILVR